MPRRSLATVLATVLLALVGWQAWRQPVDYTIEGPGPTVNVLGDRSGGASIITVDGHRSYRDDGALRLVTVNLTPVDARLSLGRLLTAWADSDLAVYPHDAVYPDQQTSEQVRNEGAQEMTSSQDNAVAAALRALHVSYGRAVKVAGVDRSGPAHGRLEAGDLLLSVDGHPTRSTQAVIARIKPLPPGSTVRLGVERSGARRTVTVTTAPLATSGADAKHSRVGVQIAPSYDFPFQVDVHISDNIGGPSGGLIFSLAIYDVLTPGSLTHGDSVAGTGTIDADGRVGVIGGIQQKIVGAERDGARLFLVPAGNCAEALGAHYDPSRIRLVRVATMPQALAAVKTWAGDHTAKLPECTR